MNRKDLHTNTSWLKLPRIAGIFATALVAAAIHTAAMAQDEQSGNSGKTENPAAQNRTAEKESSDGTIRELDPMVIADTRTATPISETTRSVTTLDREMIEEQAELDLNLSNILGQTVPGMSPSTEAVSNFGQSLRGRNFLVLVDGVPQSTPLRDGFRDLNTIDPSAIERIEVVRGGSAAYGFGAAGGLVNIITKEPSSENFSGYSSVGASFSTEHFEDSGQYRTSHRISGTKDQWSYVAALGFVERNSRFDSDGKRIPPDPLGAQGGFSDTTQWDFLGKLGYEFDAGDQRFDFMVNYFDVEQDTDYIFGSPSTLGFDPLPNSKRTPAVRTSQAVPGSANIKNPGTENFVTNLQYQNDAWLGGSARVNAYYGDQTAIFSKFPGFPQSRIESEKYGTRYTANTPLDSLLDRMELTWGLDFIHDETVQNVFGAGTTADTVALEQDALAGFAELEVPVGDIGQIRSGVRHEIIEVDVDTVDPNRFGNTVLGGDLGFDETLFNLSGVYFLSDTMELFGGFSQGFSLNDLGRSIDDAGGPFVTGNTFQAEQFETEAEKVDNYEIGLRKSRGDFQFSLVAFYSESDNGATFDQDLAIQKVSEEIHGIEASADYRINQQWQVGGTFSYSEGERELQGAEEDLPNTRISPEKVTAYLRYAPFEWWSNRLQTQYIGDRDPDSTGFGSGEVDGYTLVDLTSRFDVGPGHLTLSVNNLFNEDYFPAINQAYNSAFSYAKGPGRRVGLSYEFSW